MIKISTHHGSEIVQIELRNAAKRNALSRSVLTGLRDAFAAAARNTALRAVILSAQPTVSTGKTKKKEKEEKEEEEEKVTQWEGNVFSSGHDLREMTTEGSSSTAEETFRLCEEVMLSMHRHPLPIIAAVEGLASAAGCQLALSADLVVCSSLSSFQTPGVRIGLFCHTPAVAVVRSMPMHVAKEALFTARAITAAEALQHGFVNRVTAPGEAVAAAVGLAEAVCRSGTRETVAAGKAVLHRQAAAASVEEAYRTATPAMVEGIRSSDAVEGIAAFLQKRKPNWTS